MKFKEDRPFANPEAAMAKLLEIANGIDADHAGRISVGAITQAFLRAGGNVNRIRRGDASGGCRRLAGIISVRCLREVDAEGRGWVRVSVGGGRVCVLR